MKSTYFIFSLLFLGACELKEAKKIEKGTLQMSESHQDSDSNRQLFYDFGVRYDADEPNPSASNLQQEMNNNPTFREKYLYSLELVQGVFNKPIEEFPSASFMNQKIMDALNELQNPIAYQEASNYFLCLAIRGYFKRLPSLTYEHKTIIGNYLNILVAQKNMELEVLTWALQQMNGFWTSEQIKQTAQTILNRYEQYAIASGLKNSLKELKAHSSQPSYVQHSILSTQVSFDRDDLVLPILQNMAD